jgi:hypothetical protein
MKLAMRLIVLTGLMALLSLAANAGATFVIGPAPMGPAYAFGTATLGFDDLPGTIVPIPNGYGNLNWNNFYYLDAVNYYGNPSGYLNGMVSPNNVAFNGFGDPATVYSSLVDPFYILSGYITGAWRDGLEINIVGYNAGNPVISGDFLIDSTGPTYFYATGVVLIDSLVITSSGGVNPGYGLDGTQFALDNLTLYTTPETATLLLVGTGLLGLVRKLRK